MALQKQAEAWKARRAAMDHTLTQTAKDSNGNPIEDVWDADKQKTIDQLVANEKPGARRAPVRAGIARNLNRFER
jgi:hypothetical protein